MKKITLLIVMTMITSFEIFAQSKIGIVLSGGGALGYAHIGALKSLEEHGIFPEYIAGASMGSVIGLLYADGQSPDEIKQMVYDEKFYKLFKILSPSLGKDKSGISSHKNILDVFNRYVAHNSFDSLQKKLFVSVTNLTKECSEIVGTGDHLKQYILASASIPAVFEVVEINGDLYVDGGTLNNFPAQAIREQCDYLIGFDVKPFTKLKKNEKMKDIAGRTLCTIIHNNSKEGRKMCDYMIDCFALDYYTSFDYEKFQEIYQIGYETMNQYLGANPEMVSLLTKNKKNKKK